MRVLLTGANGMLARALVETAPSNVELLARSRAELDVTDPEAIDRELGSTKPTVIINAAAYTAVDRAESDIDAAERVNGIAPGLLGAAAARIGAKMVHYSTDHVFDGASKTQYSEGASTYPINAYGRSKLAGESALRHSGARHLIIRTQWLFGSGGHNFPSAMWERAVNGVATRVVSDQSGAPTFTEDLAVATWSLLEQDGILHVVNEGVATWYDVAKRVFAAAGSLPHLEPCRTVDFPVAARRPGYSVLSTSRLGQLGLALPRWQQSLDQYIARLALKRDQ